MSATTLYLLDLLSVAVLAVSGVLVIARYREG